MNRRPVKGFKDTYAETRRLALIRDVVEQVKILGARGRKEILLKSIEKRAQEISPLLLDYPDKTGGIGPPTKRWKHPVSRTTLSYVKVAETMGWIKAMVAGNRWMVTKFGAVLCEMPRNKNPFYLTLHEKAVFLKRLLAEDFDYSMSLLLLLRLDLRPGDLIKDFKEEQRDKDLEKQQKHNPFRDQVIFQLESRIGTKLPFMKKKYFQDRIIKKKEVEWMNRSVLNHRITPRIGWFFDLGLCNLDSSLSECGKCLLDQFAKFKDGKSFFDYPEDWFDNSFYHVFHRIYSDDFERQCIEIKNWSSLSPIFRKDVIKKLLDQTLSILGGITVDRILATSFLEYFCTYILMTKGIRCEFAEAKEALEEISQEPDSKYRYYWSKEREEGYVIILA